MADDCAECGRPIAEDPDGRKGERGKSSFDPDLCVPCGNEAFVEQYDVA